MWFLSGRIDTLSGRIDSSRAEVLTQVRQIDEKNESAHAGIVARIDSSRTEALARADAHAAKLDAVAHDVAFLAGRQKGCAKQSARRKPNAAAKRRNPRRESSRKSKEEPQRGAARQPGREER